MQRDLAGTATTGRESQDVAEYFAARRGIPRSHLLGLGVTEQEAKPAHLRYRDSFQLLRDPVRHVLEGDRGTLQR